MSENYEIKYFETRLQNQKRSKKQTLIWCIFSVLMTTYFFIRKEYIFAAFWVPISLIGIGVYMIDRWLIKHYERDVQRAYDNAEIDELIKEIENASQSQAD